MKLLKLKKTHQKVIDRQRRKKLVLTCHIQIYGKTLLNKISLSSYFSPTIPNNFENKNNSFFIDGAFVIYKSTP